MAVEFAARLSVRQVQRVREQLERNEFPRLQMLIACTAMIVYSAPLTFAAPIVDGALSARLYRQLSGIGLQGWLGTALRRTGLPFPVTAAVVSAVGWALSLLPAADSIGALIRHALQ